MYNGGVRKSKALKKEKQTRKVEQKGICDLNKILRHRERSKETVHLSLENTQERKEDTWERTLSTL